MAESTNTTAYIGHVRDEADKILNYLGNYYLGFSQTTVSMVSQPSPNFGSKFAPMPIAGISNALDQFIIDINAITFPTYKLPTPPNLTQFTSPQWNETWWTNLKTAVQLFLDPTDTTETDTLQSAMYQKDLARRQQTLRDLYSAANAQTGKAGFLYPNSMTTGLLLDAQQKFQFDDATSSRDIYKYVIEWAKSNYQFALKSTIDTHAADYEFNVKYAAVLVDCYTATVMGVIHQYKEQILGEVAKLDAQVKAYGLQIEVYKTNSQIDSEGCRALTEDFMARIRNSIDSTNAMVSANLEQAKARSAAATAALGGLQALGQSASQIVIGNGA